MIDYASNKSVFEELISKTSYIHSYMLLICSLGHSKKANFQHKIYCKKKMVILIEIKNGRYKKIQILQFQELLSDPVIKFEDK